MRKSWKIFKRTIKNNEFKCTIINNGFKGSIKNNDFKRSTKNIGGVRFLFYVKHSTFKILS